MVSERQVAGEEGVGWGKIVCWLPPYLQLIAGDGGGVGGYVQQPIRHELLIHWVQKPSAVRGGEYEHPQAPDLGQYRFLLGHPNSEHQFSLLSIQSTHLRKSL